MFDELIFTCEMPAKDDAYVGGGAGLPTDLAWPCSPDGVPLTHLMAFPGRWFSEALIDGEYWVSVFMPYQLGDVAHYGGDLDRALPEHKGVLSDGMGYLFLDEDFSERTGAGIGRFFLQLG
ncbi:hypothetical protein [Pseudomonas protegens]|uniref:hypothetical protein n=1 Tax=Pseudomonas protegens TaxID=380021 RepID=UPI000E1EB5F9|nr:hypothetical protein [Pseudomonas protegens]AXK57457.1 hypothetical protein DWF74_01845 [Pseudomonas protegens]